VAPQSPPDQPTTDRLNYRQRRSQARDELLAVLQDRWPQTFPADFARVRPFALGIHHEILKALPEVKLSLIRYTIQGYQWRGYGAYYRALAEGGPRYNLAGTPTGEVTAEEQEHAKQTLVDIAARWKAKRARRPQATPARPSEQSQNR
jgi:ProP effector